ncbi:hypothetical protein HF576_05075 [Microbacterium sp. CFH 90308]|uniref:Mandelate racemase n=1 Tax=Microbacterium salsuginis TaxID=2722803 RepID=A0ABX1K942_9MICO|nr:hypothetical protein [Microbacterium sp. CFH 90308]NLP83210.1 hypothetical protein [Microbacterium sp. CFH 90308]
MIAITDVDLRVAAVRTRLPFRYGIAEMTAAPHVAVEVRIRDGQGPEVSGWASEHLPPKWFTKNPHTSFSDDLADMVEVVERAAAFASGLYAPDAFQLWRLIDAAQMRWAGVHGVPGLLAGLGTSLVERAMIDAVCRAQRIPFPVALRSGVLGFDPGTIHEELEGVRWRALFPDRPATSIALRHTVALTDPLHGADVQDHPVDDLPVSLESVLLSHRVRYLKVKTVGDPVVDRDRLATIFGLCEKSSITPRLTIDGNESMRDGGSLTSWIGFLLRDPDIGGLLRESLIAVEQPLHRDVALGAELAVTLATLMEDGVAVIIDESDDDLHAVRRAMDLGYAGGTYKGCKGVFRGLANAALVANRRRLGHRTLLTAEDLSTLPPLTVAQDLVVAATMGLEHVERNGQHYFGRLAPISPDADGLAVSAHPDLYQLGSDGGAHLRISDGMFAIGSILDAPFGFAPELNLTGLQELSIDSARAAI